jgi:hypothetical protein
MTTTRPGPGRAPFGDRGSAFLAALLALLVLTIIGLAVSLTTRTEMLVGGAERSIQRVFYAADSGLSLSISRGLANDFEAHEDILPDPDSPALLNLRHRVETARFQEINQTYCDLCNINRSGEHGGDIYYHIYYAANADAERLGGLGTSLARMSVGTIAEMQPRKSVIEALEDIDDPSAMAKIRF